MGSFFGFDTSCLPSSKARHWARRTAATLDRKVAPKTQTFDISGKKSRPHLRLLGEFGRKIGGRARQVVGDRPLLLQRGQRAAIHDLVAGKRGLQHIRSARR